MEFGLLTDRGKVRRKNEDSVYGVSHDPSSGFFMVADGMGGHGFGDVASSIARTVVEKKAESTVTDIRAGMSAKDVLQELIDTVQDELIKMCDGNEKMNSMGTTLVIGVLIDACIHVLNCGDSRLYRYANRQLQRLTVDHSMVREMVESGVLSEEEAEHHPQKNILTRAVSCDSPVEPDFYEYQVEEGDILLFCTDGLTNMVEENAMIDIIDQSEPMSIICEQLIAAANDNGGVDNITCIAVRIEQVSNES